MGHSLQPQALRGHQAVVGAGVVHDMNIQVGQCGGDVRGVMPQHHRHLGCTGLLQAVHMAANQRLAIEQQQGFGPVSHARTRTGCEQDRSPVHQ